MPFFFSREIAEPIEQPEVMATFANGIAYEWHWDHVLRAFDQSAPMPIVDVESARLALPDDAYRVAAPDGMEAWVIR